MNDPDELTRTNPAAETDPIRFAGALSADARAIITEEVGILKRLREHLASYIPSWRDVDYDESLLELRDSLGEASEDEVAQIVRDECHARKEFVPVQTLPFLGDGGFSADPVEVRVGGAIMFVLAVERFVRT